MYVHSSFVNESSKALLYMRRLGQASTKGLMLIVHTCSSEDRRESTQLWQNGGQSALLQVMAQRISCQTVGVGVEIPMVGVSSSYNETRSVVRHWLALHDSVTRYWALTLIPPMVVAHVISKQLITPKLWLLLRSRYYIQDMYTEINICIL